MSDYGPNHPAVSRIVERARALSGDEARAIHEARLRWAEARSSDDERQAVARALRTARDSGRYKAYQAARHNAAAAFRQARRGTVGPWLSVATAVANAAAATVVADLLKPRVYDLLSAPWHEGLATAHLMALGPGVAMERTQFGAAPRRRPGSLVRP